MGHLYLSSDTSRVQLKFESLFSCIL
jgi:hypothetical protein